MPKPKFRIPRIEPPFVRAMQHKISPEMWIQSVSIPGSFVSYWDLNRLVIEGGGVPSMRKFINDNLSKYPRIVVVARAFDSGKDLANLLIKSGLAPDELGFANLTHQEIQCLAPHSMVLLYGFLNFKPNKDNFKSIVNEVCKVDVPIKIPENFPRHLTIQTLDVGLIWDNKGDLNGK